jgi:hypothetical protein
MSDRNLSLEQLFAEATSFEEVSALRAWLTDVERNGYRMDAERRAASVLLKMLPVLKEPEPKFKFNLFDLLVHKKTGGVYCIIGLPHTHRLESTGEPCYSYKGEDGLVWHRAVAEMEDGRFVHKPVVAGRFNCGRFGGVEE